MKIRALAALSKGSTLTPYEYEKEVSSHDVVIKVKYATLSNSDVMFIDNLWNDTRYPVVPSEDIIGEVVEVGESVADIKIGEIVGVGYQVYSCGVCDYCKKGLEQFCKQQKNLRIHENGGLSNRMVVNHKFAFPLPENLKRPEATPLFCAGLTVYSAIFHNHISKDMKVGVVGIGRLGHLALKFLRSIGCEVTAFTNASEKVEELQQNSIAILNPKENLEKYSNEFDFILFSSTIDLDWDTFIKLLKPNGTLHFVGFPQNKVTFSSYLLNDYATRSISGSYIGSREDMQNMINYASKNKILADIQTFPLIKSDQVLSMVREGKVKYIAVVTI